VFNMGVAPAEASCLAVWSEVYTKYITLTPEEEARLLAEAEARRLAEEARLRAEADDLAAILAAEALAREQDEARRRALEKLAELESKRKALLATDASDDPMENYRLLVSMTSSERRKWVLSRSPAERRNILLHSLIISSSVRVVNHHQKLCNQSDRGF